MDWVGSRWWKFDFHCHTPASSDYGKGLNQEEHKSVSPKEWLINYMKGEIDCIAVTDHNCGSWVDLLKQALSELASEDHEDYRELYIFPGVEITASDGIHILAILPQEKTTSDIDTLLGAVGLKQQNDNCLAAATMSSAGVIETITSHGGLAIPAHVDQECGLFSAPTPSLKQVLNSSDVIAIEIGDIHGKKPTLYNDSKLRWTEVLGSDSHHPSGSSLQSFPGSHYTWIKMSTPSIEGLKLALLDGELSIRRSDRYEGCPNDHGDPMIEKIVVRDAQYLGRGGDFVAKFNPWLNSIIGGRGTGKSTTLELLRNALARDTEIPANLSDDFKKYREVSTRRGDEGLLTKDASVSVYYLKDEARFRVDWRYPDETQAFTEKASGDWEATLGSIAQRFPIRIYSQKQIFELAKDPDSLMKIIDDASEINYEEWEHRWNELFNQYMTKQAAVRETRAGLGGESAIQGQLEDVRRKLDVFHKSGHEAILKDYHARDNQNKALDSWETSWSNWSGELNEFINKLAFQELSFEELPPSSEEFQEVQSVIERLDEDLESIRAAMAEAKAKLDNVGISWQQERAKLSLTTKIGCAKESYEALVAQLEEEKVGNPSEYATLVDEEQKLVARLRTLSEKASLFRRQEEEAKEILGKLLEHRKVLTQRRADFISDTLAGNQHVRIQIIPFGNKGALEDELRGLIGRKQSGFDDDIEKLLLELRDAVEPGISRIENIKETINMLYKGDESTVQSVKDRRFANHIQGLDPENIDRLQCWFPADSVNVSFSLKGREKFSPISQGSPGQKTAALLAFILSYGDEPLILDQPEDDLDNELIYDLIVQQLRDIKLRRQVIVVTHNANIVVNGDAENVIALDIKCGQTQIIAQGGLQEASIRGQICKFMEGGTTAFEERYRRINLSRRIL
ncbi:MAG: ABC transporter [Firmicutes bacterium]|nr:ABC transporter [Bacillota bacterium]